MIVEFLEHVDNTNCEVETLNLRQALGGIVPHANPASRSTDLWEWSLGGLSQNRAPSLQSALTEVELSNRGWTGLHEMLGLIPIYMKERKKE
jgi:hypothetical protein